jgi:hypothetical protein
MLARYPLRMDEIEGYLNEVSELRRLAEVRSLSRIHLAHLFEAARNYKPLDLDFFAAAWGDPLKEVIHYGKNSLPVFTQFQKRFCMPDRETPEPQRWGYNHQDMTQFTGPGYFVAKDCGDGEVVIDYYLVPPAKPAEWPEIHENDYKLSRFIYFHTRDYMRKVSDHVSIGRAVKEGKIMDAWFVLCRKA